MHNIASSYRRDRSLILVILNDLEVIDIPPFELLVCPVDRAILKLAAVKFKNELPSLLVAVSLGILARLRPRKGH